MNQFECLRLNPRDINSLSSDQVFAVHPSQDGTMWIGTDGGGLTHFDPKINQFQHQRHDPNNPNTVQSNRIIALEEDRNGMVWLGYWQGTISRFDPKSGIFQHYTNNEDKADSIRGSTIRAIYQDKKGDIWVGTENYGINVIQPQTGSIRYYPYNPAIPNSISDKYILCFYEDHKGILWIGTMGFGLNRFERQNDCFTVFQQDINNPESLSGTMVSSIIEDTMGQLWIGTNGGLSCYDRVKNKFQNFTVQDGLPNNFIKGISCDDLGFLWVSTNRGLSRLNPKTMEFQNFDKDDNLQDMIFNIGVNVKGRNGEIYIGGNNGLNVINPSSIKKNTNQPPVVISSFKAAGELIPDWEQRAARDGSVYLRYTQSFLSFEYTALNFTRAYKNRYSHRLLGLEEEWIFTGDRRYVEYTNLSPGEYTFQIKGANNDGVWSEKEASLKIIIMPPFWKTWWFQVFLGFLITGTLLLIHYSRVYTLRKQRRLLTKEVKKQTGQLMKQQEALEQANRELEELSLLDSLTNIANRRSFQNHLESEWKRAIRYQSSLSLIMIDIDFFKNYNDHYGHVAGDQCLRLVAKALQEQVQRPGDLASRYGGEEFAVILPDTSLENADSLAETIREAVESLGIPHAWSSIAPVITLSLGVSSIIPDSLKISEILVTTADQALYQAKNNGRNRVETKPII